MKINFSKIKYQLGQKALIARDLIFELVYRSKWKPFLYNHTSERIQAFLLKRRLKKLLEFPVTLSIEPTNFCNAKCWFCPQPWSKRKKGFMEFPLFKKIIDEVSPRIKKIKCLALFMDGEPSLNKNLVEFLKYAHKKKVYKINTSSNMEFFTPELTDRMLSANLGRTFRHIICSLDGIDEKTHNQNRIGVDFKKALSNTEYLIKQRKNKGKLYPRIFPRLLISELTKSHISEFKNFWKGKADKALTTETHNWGGKINEEKLSCKNLPDRFRACYLPFSQLAVQYDGLVRLCCIDSETSIVVGDLKKQTIKEIWNSEIINKIRQTHINRDIENMPDICKKCSYPRRGTWIAPYYWYK